MQLKYFFDLFLSVYGIAILFALGSVLLFKYLNNLSRHIRDKHYEVFSFGSSYDFTRDNKKIVSNPNEWMDHRFIVFDSYCFPSVINQTCKNFKWLLFYDKNKLIIKEEN